MYMKKYPCVYMRGGTSKAVIFHKEDLPADESKWDELFLKVMGSPDVKQIDGMGGTVSSTSKVAVITRSERPDADIDYTFFQVDITQSIIGRNANCGNISSAVGPYAIDEGLVPAVEPVTVVRVFNTNTKKIIEEHVRVESGHACVDGDAVIRGVPGTGSPIDMFFLNPGGAVTGNLFPTGRRRDVLDIPDYGCIQVSILDCSNPVVFIPAQALGILGTELLELNGNERVMEHIERIRCIAAERCGLVEHWEEARTLCTSVPKVAIVSAPQSYENLDGNKVSAQDMDICVRAISVGRVHKAYPITVSICTGAAALLSDTVVHDILQPQAGQHIVRLGHSSGVTPVNIEMSGERVVKGGVLRTARRIMDGFVYVRE